jgi:hypothetical protein
MKVKKLELLLYNDYSLDWSPDFEYDCESDYQVNIVEELENITEEPDKTIFWKQIS